ncbi:MAG: hypothetical protein Rpha_1813 [Candidatus Ruthia sp. Apha_13_S6]|nr:hypothetical protein [Candidatus Ruthia sp. Apha_13_S6]
MTIKGLKADPTWKINTQYSDAKVAVILKKSHRGAKQQKMF